MDHLNRPVSFFFEVKRRFESGKAKAELNNWWLELIERRVNEYLDQKGFDHTAKLPETLNAPSDSTVRFRKNLGILRNMLGSLEGVSVVRKELVNPLRNQVYERIVDFEETAKLLLWHERDSKPGIGELERDLEYIEKMRSLEDSVLLVPTNTQIADVVPITGLIFGFLKRIENEYETTFKHWTARQLGTAWEKK